MTDVAPPAELAPLLSAERLSTYRRYAPEWGLSPLSLYVLGGQLASSYHHDLGVAEVVLRNALNDQLAARYGGRWWADEALLDERGQGAVAKAYSDARCREDSPPGRLIAQLLMGFWVHLLEPGGYAGRKPFRQRRYYDALLWRPALRHAFPQSTGIRGDVHAVAHRVYALRNRWAHDFAYCLLFRAYARASIAGQRPHHRAGRISTPSLDGAEPAKWATTPGVRTRFLTAEQPFTTSPLAHVRRAVARGRRGGIPHGTSSPARQWLLACRAVATWSSRSARSWVSGVVSSDLALPVSAFPSLSFAGHLCGVGTLPHRSHQSRIGVAGHPALRLGSAAARVPSLVVEAASDHSLSGGCGSSG